MRLFKFLNIAVITLLLLACENTELSEVGGVDSDMTADLKVEGLITVKAKNLSLPTGTTFAWRESLQVIGTEDDGRSELFMSMVNKGLQDRGFVLGSRSNADYLLSSRVVLGDLSLLETEFRLDPGIISRSGDLEKGSLILVVLKPFGRIDWRGSVQIFVDDSLSREQRHQRAQLAITALLDELH